MFHVISFLKMFYFVSLLSELTSFQHLLEGILLYDKKNSNQGICCNDRLKMFSFTKSCCLFLKKIVYFMKHSSFTDCQMCANMLRIGLICNIKFISDHACKNIFIRCSVNNKLSHIFYNTYLLLLQLMKVFRLDIHRD